MVPVVKLILAIFTARTPIPSYGGTFDLSPQTASSHVGRSLAAEERIMIWQ